VWRRAALARVYALAVVFGLLLAAGWGLLAENPLGILWLPDQRADAIFHVSVAAVFVIALLADAIGTSVGHTQMSADLAQAD
jgi:hypothetical protein